MVDIRELLYKWDTQLWQTISTTVNENNNDTRFPQASALRISHLHKRFATQAQRSLQRLFKDSYDRTQS